MTAKFRRNITAASDKTDDQLRMAFDTNRLDVLIQVDAL
jgi:hypothetical protein